MYLPNDVNYIIKQYSMPCYMKPKHCNLIKEEIKKNIFNCPFYIFYFDRDYIRRYGWILYVNKLNTF